MIRRLQITLLALFVGVWAMASETSVKNADGVEIWYDFDSSAKTASVMYKGSYYYYYDEYIGNVVIPSKVTYEGKEYSVTSIGDFAFYDCGSLTSITLPKSVTSIGNFAFYDCSSLTSITLSESVTSIGGAAFYGCSSLTSIDVALDNNSYTSIDGVLFSKDKTILIKYPEGKKDVTSYIIPEGVTKIGDNVFDGCSSLTSITLPKSVTSIGGGTFQGCSSLTSITLPESVTSIGGSAFLDCSGLTSVEFNAKNCTSIGSDSYPVFFGCTKLSNLTIGENVTNIPSYAFKDCSGLTSVTIPESVTKIGSGAFWNCSSLTSITIPESVTSIEDFAFFGCSSLTSITSLNATPPSIDDFVTFIGVDKSIPVYVPKQSVEAYKSAKYWKDFTNIQGIDDTPISDIQTSEIYVRLIGNTIVVEGTDNYFVYSILGQYLGKVERLSCG